MWNNCPAYVCLARDIAEAYGVLLVFMVFVISSMTLISVTVRSYVKLKDKFIAYRSKRANVATTSKKSQLRKSISALNPFKFFK